MRTVRVAIPLLLALACSARGASAQDMDACIKASEDSLSLRKADKLVAARAALSTCASSACPDVVRTSCQQRLVETNQAIPSIVFFAKDGGGRDLVAVALSIDGAAYADHLDGSAIVLDPGEHEFRFEIPGQPPVVQRFVLHQGEKNRRADIVIGKAPPGPGPTVAVAPSSSVTPPPANQGASEQGSSRGTIGLVVGGVGVGSLIAGAIFGGLSVAAHNSYERDCGSNIGAPANQCTEQGVHGESDAATKGTLSTVFLIGGGVAAAAGALLFFTAPKVTGSAQVGLGPSGLVMAGRF